MNEPKPDKSDDSIWQSKNGHEIKRIAWTSVKGGDMLHSGNGRRLFFRMEYHGQYDSLWVIETLDDKEVARHNVNFLSDIEWL